MTPVTVGLGWLRFTTRGIQNNQHIQQLLQLPSKLEFTKCPSLFRGFYPSKAVVYFESYTITIATDGHRTYWDIPQTHCQLLGEAALREVALYARDRSAATFGRVDPYFHVPRTSLTINKVMRDTKQGRVVTRIREIKPHHDMGQQTGLTFGKRSSDFYLRVYDGYLEALQNKRDPEQKNVIVFETELKHDRSNNFVNYWLENGNFVKSASEFLVSAVDFRAKDNQRSNRRTRLFWFESIVGGAAKIQQPKKPDLKTYLDRAVDWLDTQVMPTLGAVVARYGHGWLLEQLATTLPRWSDKQFIISGRNKQSSLSIKEYFNGSKRQEKHRYGFGCASGEFNSDSQSKQTCVPSNKRISGYTLFDKTGTNYRIKAQTLLLETFKDGGVCITPPVMPDQAEKQPSFTSQILNTKFWSIGFLHQLELLEIPKNQFLTLALSTA